ncbi:MAG: DUF4167 domain-containing protein [Hyphomicrobiales bacterium]|nr:DUF4167 domain-containing protein [Hyphomicrobiales bacterium]
MALQKRYPSKKKPAERVDRARSAPARRNPNAPRSKAHRSRSTSSGQPKNSFDRYTALALAAAAAGDVIEAENYYQHAEHYYRVMKQKAA